MLPRTTFSVVFCKKTKVTKKGKLLSVPSNTKMNACLKEIAGICSIQRHLARHWFQKYSYSGNSASEMICRTSGSLIGEMKSYLPMFLTYIL